MGHLRPSIQLTQGYGYADVTSHPGYEAAEVVVSLIKNRLGFKTVLDVGCGIGIWLAEFQKKGAEEIFGIDGDWVPAEKLLIPQEAFQAHDLREPIRLGRTFDLVLSLEVAEHLPESAADMFIESLVLHGDTIVFSAAVPGQGGFQHVNEQLQDYWMSKFSKFGLTAYDAIRPAIWNDRRVPFYYAQNMIVFSRHSLPYSTEFIPTPVHPTLFQRRSDPKNYSGRSILRHLPYYAARTWRHIVNRQ